MTAADWVATSGSRPDLISATYRRLRRMGFDDPEAANISALTDGFRITSQPWTIRELTHLLFLRELDRARGEWSGAGDRESTHVDDGWRLAGRTPWYLAQSDGRVTPQSLINGALCRAAPAEKPAAAPSEPGRDGG
jgi:hypothetical protein